MANPNFNNTTTTDFETDVGSHSIDTKNTDGSEQEWINPDASKNYGYYYNVGEYRNAIKSYAIHVLGWGYTASTESQKIILENIRGNGKETFWSIIYNHLHTKKYNGDAYIQVIRDEGNLKNLKNLDPLRVKHIMNKQGIITSYKYTQSKGKVKTIFPDSIIHSMNNKNLDEPHGTSETSAVEWVLEAIQEAEIDWRRVMHFSSVRILYVDENDVARQNKLKTELAAGIKSGNIVLLTCKPEEAKFEDLVVPPADAWVRYLNNLEGKLYSQLGISKVSIGGTTENNTEASAKVNMVITEPVWIKELKEIEDDLWNQAAIKIKINKAPSMMDNVQTDEAANTGQTKLGIQGAQ